MILPNDLCKRSIYVVKASLFITQAIRQEWVDLIRYYLNCHILFKIGGYFATDMFKDQARAICKRSKLFDAYAIGEKHDYLQKALTAK